MEYFRFQNFVDNFRGHPSRQTDLECMETDFADINSGRISYIWRKYYDTASIKPTLAYLKAELLQSGKNQEAIPDETALVNVETSSSVPEPTQPFALATTTTSIDSFNHQLTPLQPLQYAMCGQLNSTHPAV